MGWKDLQSYLKYKDQFIVILCSYIGISLYGYVMTWTVPVIVLLKDPDKSPLSEAIDDITASWIASLIYVGTITGPFLGNLISTKYGRIPTLRIGCMICTIAFTLQSFLTYNIIVIYIQRILQGFGTAIIILNALAYVGEVASAEIRGSLTILLPVFQVLGIMLLLLLAPVLSFKGVGYLPGKHAASETVMKRLNREDVLKIEEKLTNSPWKEILQSKANRRALFIVMSLFILESASGISSLLFFTTSIFNMANLEIDSNTATIISYSIALAVALVSSSVIDKVGRRVLLLASTFGTFITLAVLGVYFYLDHVEYSAIDNIRWLPVVCVVLFMVSFNLGLGTIPTTLLAELFSNNIRTLGPAVTLAPAISVGFLFTTAFGYMVTSIGIHSTFWIHSAINAIAFLFTLAFVPETKGKTLEEIQELLGK